MGSARFLDRRVLFPGRETMLVAGSGGAWSQEASISPQAVGGRKASDAVHPHTANEQLALCKKNERAHTTNLLARLQLLAPMVDENKGQPGHRSKALRGRARDELLKDVIHAVRLTQGLRSDDLVLDESECTEPQSPAPTPAALIGVVFWRRTSGTAAGRAVGLNLMRTPGVLEQPRRRGPGWSPSRCRAARSRARARPSSWVLYVEPVLGHRSLR